MTEHANCYESATQPLRYADNTLVQRFDYVVCFNEKDGRVESVDYARVWDTLYFTDGTPIGTVLVPAGSPKDHIPEFFTFRPAWTNCC